MEDDDMDASPDGGVSKRACDSCRTRKIRCDRNVPCSNCKASRLTCKTTAPQQKAQRQRVHISEEYEKKIDRIEDRLAGIEHVLANLSSKLGNLDLHKDSHEASSQSRSSRVGLSRSPGSVLQEANTPAPFEGESSINIQSVYAREMLAQVIDNTPSIGQNEEVKMALTALSEMVSHQGQAGAPGTQLYNRSLAEVDPAQLEQPPWTAVSHALETAMKYPTMAFAVVFPFLKMPNLRDIFYDAYHNPDTCGAPRRMLTYGILENIYSEFLAFHPADMDVTDYATYATVCKRQSEVALSQVDLFMPASYENIMALVLGAAQAIEMCYHRINTMINDPPEEKESKIYIFWMIYMFDKTLSLRMGRSSVLQDWDISLPFILEINPSESLAHQSRLLSYWVKVARIQGLTYEKLFCPAAFLKSTEERTAIAIDLVNAMNQAWYERGGAAAAPPTNLGKGAMQTPVGIGRSPNDTPLPSQYKKYMNQRAKKGNDPLGYMEDSWERVEDIFFHSDVVTHYSTCALIQRSVSPGNMAFNKECLESSREALEANKRAAAQFNKKGQEELWSGYLHWSILQAPFTPFIVIFCNAIQTAATADVSADLNSLSEFVTSLESCRTISEGLDKLYRMCHLFLRVARFYVLAKRQDAARSRVTQSSQPDYYTTADGSKIDLNAMAQFDPYLNALGLLPDPTWSMTDYELNSTGPGGMHGFPQVQTMNHDAHLGQMGVGFGLPAGTQNSMQDWFSSSRYLMNLMEPSDDMQMPDLDL